MRIGASASAGSRWPESPEKRWPEFPEPAPGARLMIHLRVRPQDKNAQI